MSTIHPAASSGGVGAPTDGRKACASRISDIDAIDLLTGMVATPSPSREERAVAELVRDWSLAHALDAEIDDTGNVLVSFGDPDAPRLIVLLGHIDTFPGTPEVRAHDGVLYGRGSVDAKGPLAAFIVAASRARLPRDVRVLVVGAVEEECATSRGARAIADRVRPDASIIGEPSGTAGITLGYKGRLLANVTIARASAHSAGPTPSASDEAFTWWTRVLALIAGLNLDHTGAFDTVQATLRSVSSEQTGVEDRATLSAGFRLPPWLRPDELEASLRALDAGVEPVCTGAECAVVADRSNRVVRALTLAVRATGATPVVRVKTGTSDMNVVAPQWNCPIAAYGPGDSALDHTPDEHIHLDEFLRSIGVLTDAVERLSEELASRPCAGAAAGAS